MATTAKTTEHTINLRRHWTVDDYHKMIEVGILDEQDKVELIGGMVVEMSAKGRRHNRTIVALVDAFSAVLPCGEALLAPQNSFLLSDDTEPEPDVSVIRGPLERYDHRPTTAADVLLLVEVADSSLRFDRNVKLPRYARAGVPEVWIADLTGEGGVERYTEPAAEGAYGSVARFDRGQEVVSVVLAGVSMSVDQLLGQMTGADGADAVRDAQEGD